MPPSLAVKSTPGVASSRSTAAASCATTASTSGVDDAAIEYILTQNSEPTAAFENDAKAVFDQNGWKTRSRLSALFNRTIASNADSMN